MQTIDIITINTDNVPEIRTIALDHIPFMVDKKPLERLCPRSLLPVFRAVMDEMQVAIVSCRVVGMPEQADGSHIKHYVTTPESADNIRTMGLTI